MTSVDDAFTRVPTGFYIHHPERGKTLHYSDPDAIRREVTALAVYAGARVLEIGTGTGFSGAILAALTGPHGKVTSIDVSDHLAGWANWLHHQRGATAVSCHVADGTAGYPANAVYDRIIAWCTLPRLPRTWVQQLAAGGRIVACLPIAELPSTTVIAAITVTNGQPTVEAVATGGYAQSTPAPVEDPTTVPGRWVDWSTYTTPHPAWISISWRAADDWLRTGARTALDRLARPGHTADYDRAPLDWRSLSAYTASIADPRLSFAALPCGLRGIGHTTSTSAALILTDGRILADTSTSPSLIALHAWLHQWEQAGRPAPAALTPTLIRVESPDCPGWDLRLTRAPAGDTDKASQ